MPDELEERLQRHARSFDGLLSLIPAKLYYGEDVSDQWKRKKQTPEQKREAKKQKLDPDNWKSAKDVLDEREAAAKKRKREEGEELSEAEAVDVEKPKAEVAGEKPTPKKRKTGQADPQSANAETEEERIKRRKEAKAAKKDRQKERKTKAKEKLERQKAKKRGDAGKNEPEQPDQQSKTKKDKKPSQPKPQQDSDDGDDGDEDMAEEIQIEQQPPNTFTTVLDDDQSESDASEDEPADVFSPPQESAVSSTSSVQQPAEELSSSKPAEPTAPADANLPPARERLANAIANFRTQRKAHSDSVPKSRAELLEQRRRQEEHRRAEKKEQKRREKEEAQRKQEEEIAARFSPGGSGSLLASPRSPVSTPDTETNNFSFGKIAFDDGSSFDPQTKEVVDPKRKKGPSDPSTALQAALKKKSRLSGLDEDKQERIASQDRWASARKRAAGEKVKDDTSLLKKALKRHEGQKKKSEKEWIERKDGIQKSIDAKQKKRTENLAKRKEEKGKGKGKKVKRPGFEGSFKGRTGGKKGKA